MVKWLYIPSVNITINVDKIDFVVIDGDEVCITYDQHEVLVKDETDCSMLRTIFGNDEEVFTTTEAAAPILRKQEERRMGVKK